ncbi:hypothetical protein HDU67_001729, partial [Dinochytrium kinnereticum]
MPRVTAPPSSSTAFPPPVGGPAGSYSTSGDRSGFQPGRLSAVNGYQDIYLCIIFGTETETQLFFFWVLEAE